jgi:flagellar protein FlbD
LLGDDSLITITKLNDKEMVINSDLIESIEAMPDTTVTMTTGRKYIIKTSIDEMLEKVIEFRRQINIKTE